jgi:hypothetical protein
MQAIRGEGVLSEFTRAFLLCPVKRENYLKEIKKIEKTI